MSTIEAPFLLQSAETNLSGDPSMAAESPAEQLRAIRPDSCRTTSIVPEKFAQAVSAYLPDPADLDNPEGTNAGACPQALIAAIRGTGHHERIRCLIRENSRLVLLNTLFRRIGGCLEAPDILSALVSGLAEFSIQAKPSVILWEWDAGEISRAEIFLPQPLHSDESRLSNDLIQSGREHTGQQLGQTSIRRFMAKITTAGLPERYSKHVWPLESDGRSFGIIRFDVAAGSSGFMDSSLLTSLVQQLTPQLAGAINVSRLRRQADYDELTGLPNRRSFDKRLNEEVKRHHRQGRPMSLIMLDADDFKAVNDSFGHQAGDAILSELGRCIRASVRETDVAARYGGEEFAVLLPDSDEAAASVLAARLQANWASTSMAHFETDLPCSFSLGIASLQSGEEPDGAELIRRGDRALYSAKRSGKNTSQLYSRL